MNIFDVLIAEVVIVTLAAVAAILVGEWYSSRWIHRWFNVIFRRSKG